MCVYGDGGGRNSAKTVPVGAGDGLRQLLAFNDLLMDTEDGFRRLEEALRYLDSLEAAGGGEDCGSDDCGGPGPDDRDTGTKTALTWLAAPEKKRKLSEAWGANDGQCAFRMPPEP